MIPEIIKQWEENKHFLREYFSSTNQSEYEEYKDIVKLIFKLVIKKFDDFYGFDIEKMTIIDDGDYQGTQVFIIPKSTYQPSVNEYIVTNTYYGSCEGCDTLLAIADYGDKDNIPTKSQVNKYMTLALHLVQKMRWLEESHQAGMNLQNLMNQTSKWSDETFDNGNFTRERSIPILHHLKKEIGEAIEATDAFFKNPTSDNFDKAGYELADMLILLADASNHFGYNADQLLTKCFNKIDINKSRKWGKPDENGVVEHIRN